MLFRDESLVNLLALQGKTNICQEMQSPQPSGKRRAGACDHSRRVDQQDLAKQAADEEIHVRLELNLIFAFERAEQASGGCIDLFCQHHPQVGLPEIGKALRIPSRMNSAKLQGSLHSYRNS
jgi:hypothetical protein